MLNIFWNSNDESDNSNSFGGLIDMLSVILYTFLVCLLVIVPLSSPNEPIIGVLFITALVIGTHAFSHQDVAHMGYAIIGVGVAVVSILLVVGFSAVMSVSIGVGTSDYMDWIVGSILTLIFVAVYFYSRN